MSKKQPEAFTEYQIRAMVAAGASVAAGHPTAGTFAMHLAQWAAQARWEGRSMPFLTHCKAAQMRNGAQHRNTTRQLFKLFILGGIIEVNGEDQERVQARIAAGEEGYAPGFNSSKHVTPYRINWTKVYAIAKKARRATCTAMKQFKDQCRRWKRDARDSRMNARNQREQSHRSNVIAQLKAASKREHDQRNLDRRSKLFGSGKQETIGDILQAAAVDEIKTREIKTTADMLRAAAILRSR